MLPQTLSLILSKRRSNGDPFDAAWLLNKTTTSQFLAANTRAAIFLCLITQVALVFTSKGESVPTTNSTSQQPSDSPPIDIVLKSGKTLKDVVVFIPATEHKKGASPKIEFLRDGLIDKSIRMLIEVKKNGDIAIFHPENSFMPSWKEFEVDIRG
jgi:hypothetical protein